MHVSRKADYAVRALSYLASNVDRRVLISEVSKATAAPRPFLSKIMKELVQGGLVVSRVGPGGGYSLARAPSEINFRKIIEIVEGSWDLVPCQREGDDSCLLHSSCSQVGTWDNIRLQMLEVLEGYTLEHVSSGSQRAVSLGSLPLASRS